MKTVIWIVLASTISILAVHSHAQNNGESVGEKAADAWDATKDKAKQAGHAAARAAKKAKAAVIDIVTPDPDANKVNVTVTDERINMPKSIEPGKTAFVVRNSGKEKHNFEVRGPGIGRKFLLVLAPGETKILQAELKPGRYKAYCLMSDHENKNIVVDLAVR